LTDCAAGPGQRATLVVATGSTWADALPGVLPGPITSEPVLILPSSLRRADPLATALRDMLRASRVPSHLLLPANPAAAIAGHVARSGTAGWATTDLRPPDIPPATITLPLRLTGPEPIWSVTDVDRVGGKGPYVLDLIARYLHPRSRLRLLASQRRSDAAVDVNLVARPSRGVVGKAVGNGVIVGVVDDPIAAELVALALADELLPPGWIATGPWEERVVQRATELQLGIQIPQQLAVSVIGTPAPDALTTIRRATDRIGVMIA